MNEPVAIGIVRKPFGVSGQCYVSAFGDTLSIFKAPCEILAGKDAQSSRLCTITELRQSPKGFTVRFMGIDDMNAAETMRDEMLFVDSKELPGLGEGRHYSFELIGCTVVAFEDKTVLGTVVDVESYPTVDCLVVRRENGVTFLLSMAPDIIKQIDKQAKCVIVAKRAVEDLLE